MTTNISKDAQTCIESQVYAILDSVMCIQYERYAAFVYVSGTVELKQLSRLNRRLGKHMDIGEIHPHADGSELQICINVHYEACDD